MADQPIPSKELSKVYKRSAQLQVLLHELDHTTHRSTVHKRVLNRSFVYLPVENVPLEKQDVLKSLNSVKKEIRQLETKQ